MESNSKYQTRIGRRFTKLDDDFNGLSFTNQAEEPKTALTRKDKPFADVVRES